MWEAENASRAPPRPSGLLYELETKIQKNKIEFVEEKKNEGRKIMAID